MIISHPIESRPGLFCGKFRSLEEYDTSVLKIIDRLAEILKSTRFSRSTKIIIPLQTLLNLLLSLWIYEEYVNNRYLREYVNGLLQAGALAAIVLISTGFLIGVGMFLYAKLRSYRRELGLILSTGTFRPMEEGLVKRSTRELKRILSRLFRRLRRS
jgi:hypothetical protein